MEIYHNKFPWEMQKKKRKHYTSLLKIEHAFFNNAIRKNNQKKKKSFERKSIWKKTNFIAKRPSTLATALGATDDVSTKAQQALSFHILSNTDCIPTENISS